jgi:glycosyltransferase involved in cell wall biosynthesis/GR25 family glycosyltransferase involved in LPS biosynthesis
MNINRLELYSNQKTKIIKEGGKIIIIIKQNISTPGAYIIKNMTKGTYDINITGYKESDGDTFIWINGKNFRFTKVFIDKKLSSVESTLTCVFNCPKNGEYKIGILTTGFKNEDKFIISDITVSQLTQATKIIKSNSFSKNQKVKIKQTDYGIMIINKQLFSTPGIFKIFNNKVDGKCCVSVEIANKQLAKPGVIKLWISGHKFTKTFIVSYVTLKKEFQLKRGNYKIGLLFFDCKQEDSYELLNFGIKKVIKLESISYMTQKSTLIELEKKIKTKNAIIGITTYNRLKYLKNCIDTFLKTKSNKLNWTIIIADDGSTDGTLKYIKTLTIPNIPIILIKNKTSHICHQTNTILETSMYLDYDIGFKIDDDLIFDKKGWDLHYISAFENHGYDHLVYYSTNYRNAEVLCKKNELISYCKPENCMGCLWTFTKRMIKKVGYLNEERFVGGGHGHQEYTVRCCRAKFNNPNTIFDIEGMKKFIRIRNNKTENGKYISHKMISHQNNNKKILQETIGSNVIFKEHKENKKNISIFYNNEFDVPKTLSKVNNINFFKLKIITNKPIITTKPIISNKPLVSNKLTITNKKIGTIGTTVENITTSSKNTNNNKIILSPILKEINFYNVTIICRPKTIDELNKNVNKIKKQFYKNKEIIIISSIDEIRDYIESNLKNEVRLSNFENIIKYIITTDHYVNYDKNKFNNPYYLFDEKDWTHVNSLLFDTITKYDSLDDEIIMSECFNKCLFYNSNINPHDSQKLNLDFNELFENNTIVYQNNEVILLTYQNNDNVFEITSDTNSTNEHEQKHEQKIKILDLCNTIKENDFKEIQLNDEFSSTNLFGNVFVLNLSNDKIKRKSMQNKLNKKRIQYQIFRAVNGFKEPYLSKYNEYRRNIKNGDPLLLKSAGAYGYLLSWEKLILKAIGLKLDSFVLFEDDIIFHNKYEEMLGDFLKTLGKRQWKTVLLGGSQYNSMFASKHNANTTNGFYHCNKHTNGSFGIAIHNSIYKELLTEIRKYNAAFDYGALGEIYKKYPRKCFILYPNLVIADISKSGIFRDRNVMEHSKIFGWNLSQYELSFVKMRVSIILYIDNASIKNFKQILDSIINQTYINRKTYILDNTFNQTLRNKWKKYLCNNNMELVSFSKKHSYQYCLKFIFKKLKSDLIFLQHNHSIWTSTKIENIVNCLISNDLNCVHSRSMKITYDYPTFNKDININDKLFKMILSNEKNSNEVKDGTMFKKNIGLNINNISSELCTIGQTCDNIMSIKM